jgi:hypothetical protein
LTVKTTIAKVRGTGRLRNKNTNHTSGSIVGRIVLGEIMQFWKVANNFIPANNPSASNNDIRN